MNDLLSIMTIVFWPVIPLFWIPVHFASSFFKKIGLMTYIIPLITWLPAAYLLYLNRAFLLKSRLDIPFSLHILGTLFFIAGTLLHIWTARLLGLRGIIGVPEISSTVKDHLVMEGPFSLVRHPTYVAHTFIFFGVFLITGTVSVGVIAIVDFIIVNAIVIPLEERELLSRFDEAYRLYKKNVPFSFFPLRHGKI
jgi:protein-S-isoprenylcysteine O-methyltransferase Ste14